ncbi:hypothetical protein [Antiquaquibacter soli]|uniref:Uncharacterized protein n=1 Tax=Antiquaquibacter soli TaxID=3064523 RepID=A0ABT9BMA8_9MICO|nr:hypothetical protein [Protaetiibacter sp. WY-16]MDO7882104.1 hypothetical protein [Protaetiibacter sp. WY-16]
MRRSWVLGLIGLVIVLTLSGCVRFSGYGVRLNASGTVDAVNCGSSHAVTRILTQPDWEVVSVFDNEVRRSELVVDEWTWSGTSPVPYAPERPCALGAQFVSGPVSPSLPAVVLVAAVVSTALAALLLAIRLTLSTHRHRRSDAGDRRFWLTVGLLGVPMAVEVALGVPRLLEDDPTALVLPLLLGGPLSVIPAVEFVVAAGLIRPAEWAAFGYLLVSLATLVAIPAWAFISIVGVRRLTQSSAERSSRGSLPSQA